MKQIICLEPGKFERREVVALSPESGKIILKIRRIGICGTDLHAYEGTQPFFSYPRVLGHELACEIAQDRNSDLNLKKGDPVTFIPYFPCNTCIACRNGKPNCCTNIQGAGVHIDGGMTEYIQIPEYALIDGKGLTFDELAMVEPMAIGAHAIRITEISADEYVLITGAGPIGLGVMAFAKISGAKVIAMDVNNDRLEFAKKYFGVDYTVNALENPAEQIGKITNGEMVTAVIDATGNKRAIEGSLEFLAHGGRITMVGIQREAFSFNHPEFHKRETTLRSSRNATREDFDQVVENIRNGKVNVAALISHRLPFDSLPELFPQLLNPQMGVIKAIVELD
ncbi:MAG: zinc-binding alcohol dehydrogenase family protein [Mariniphaga sp.]